ncbi:hypothetical protein [Palleronia marisminoris]|uniref:hypothetical protein n=1 Tax=Palleronia marisminoris TaxID=315423 RepID=UPI0011133225|nr:hypothetical protein [Palleronia marisminoris]
MPSGPVAIRADVKCGSIFYEVVRKRGPVERDRGRRCSYLTRPSDSVFSSGSSYVIKSHERAGFGCVF